MVFVIVFDVEYFFSDYYVSMLFSSFVWIIIFNNEWFIWVGVSLFKFEVDYWLFKFLDIN